jgi:alkanesulfonate monooxygenase SsuD/methylene tetrahydromethanopterin reductase-like flavin-dependent oxidoreductase (luciferase family)
LKFAYFNQLQMPKPWAGEDAEVQLYRHAMEQAVWAEAVGFDSYWQTEHHFYTEIGHSSAPEVFLAALAQRTSRIRLGLGVVVLPCNHPFRVAEQVATLDVLSDGRVELGTGRGASTYHIEAFGVSPEESKAVWRESLEVLCSLFVNDKFPGHKGTYYDLPARSLVPKPIQKPHPPIWVAATQPTTFAEAARLGIGVLGLTTISPEDLIPAIQAYRAAQQECVPVGGYANHQVSAYSICYLDEDDRRGRDIACAGARWYLGDNTAELQALRFGTIVGGQDNTYHEQIRDTVRDRLGIIRSRTNDQLIEDGIVIGGNPDTACRQIERYARIGIDQIMVMMQVGNTTHDQVMRSLELFGKHVISRFGDPTASPAPPAEPAPIAAS